MEAVDLTAASICGFEILNRETSLSCAHVAHLLTMLSDNGSGLASEDCHQGFATANLDESTVFVSPKSSNCISDLVDDYQSLGCALPSHRHWLAQQTLQLERWPRSL